MFEALNSIIMDDVIVVNEISNVASIERVGSNGYDLVGLDDGTVWNDSGDSVLVLGKYGVLVSGSILEKKVDVIDHKLPEICISSLNDDAHFVDTDGDTMVGVSVLPEKIVNFRIDGTHDLVMNFRIHADQVFLVSDSVCAFEVIQSHGLDEVLVTVKVDDFSGVDLVGLDVDTALSGSEVYVLVFGDCGESASLRDGVGCVDRLSFGELLSSFVEVALDSGKDFVFLDSGVELLDMERILACVAMESAVGFVVTVLRPDLLEVDQLLDLIEMDSGGFLVVVQKVVES